MPFQAWLALVYLGVFSSFLCLTMQTVAQKYTPSSHVSLILSLEAVFAALLGVLLLSEVMTMRIIGGVLFIMLGIILVEMLGNKKWNSN